MHWHLNREQARRPQDLKPQTGQVQNLCAPRGSVIPITYLVVWDSLAGIVLHTLSTANHYCIWYIFTTYGWTIPSYPYISRIFYVKAIGGRKQEFLLLHLSTGLQLILWIGAKIMVLHTQARAFARLTLTNFGLCYVLLLAVELLYLHSEHKGF